MKHHKILLVLPLLALYTTVYAQYTEVINSNRPGVSESAFSVGTGVLQLEAGANNLKEEHTLMQYDVSGFGIDFSLRYGAFFEQLEFSIGGVYQNDTQTITSSQIPVEHKRANFKALTIGAKYLVFDPHKNAEETKPSFYSYHANRTFQWKSLIPAISIYAGINYNTNSNPFIADGLSGVSPKIMIATQNNFNGGWVLVSNIIVNHLFSKIENEAFYKSKYGNDYTVREIQQLITLTHAINQKWVVFGEWQGLISDFYSDSIFRVGGAYLWNKNFQLDANIAFNTKDTPSIFHLGFGASYRLDFHSDKEIKNSSVKSETK